jgi:N-methylhydantoinase B/oxoprolinase/acetone carboxylase alpha subunit
MAPTFHYVRIYVLNLDALRNMRSIFLFDGTRSLDSFRQHMRSPSNVVSGNWHASHRLIHAIFTAESTALSDMVYFLQEANRVVFQMVRA